MFLDFNFSKVLVWPICPCLTLFLLKTQSVKLFQLLKGARLTAIFDSCHSATALDLPFVYDSYGQVWSFFKAFSLSSISCTPQESIVVSFYFLFGNILNLQPKKQKYSRKTAALDLLQSGLKMTKVGWTCWPNLTKLTKLCILIMLTKLTKITPSRPSSPTVDDLVDQSKPYHDQGQHLRQAEWSQAGFRNFISAWQWRQRSRNNCGDKVQFCPIFRHHYSCHR